MPLNIVLDVSFFNKALHKLFSQIFPFFFSIKSLWILVNFCACILCIFPLGTLLLYPPCISSLHLLIFPVYCLYRLTAYSSLCPFPPAQHSPNLSHQAQFSPSVRFWMIIFFLLHSISTSPVRAICFS